MCKLRKLHLSYSRIPYVGYVPLVFLVRGWKFFLIFYFKVSMPCHATLGVLEMLRDYRYWPQEQTPEGQVQVCFLVVSRSSCCLLRDPNCPQASWRQGVAANETRLKIHADMHAKLKKDAKDDVCTSSVGKSLVSVHLMVEGCSCEAWGREFIINMKARAKKGMLSFFRFFLLFSILFLGFLGLGGGPDGIEMGGGKWARKNIPHWFFAWQSGVCSSRQ